MTCQGKLNEIVIYDSGDIKTPVSVNEKVSLDGLVRFVSCYYYMRHIEFIAHSIDEAKNVIQAWQNDYYLEGEPSISNQGGVYRVNITLKSKQVSTQ